MVEAKGKGSFSNLFFKLGAGSIAILFLSAIALMAIPAYSTQASGMTSPNTPALAAVAGDISAGSPVVFQRPADSVVVESVSAGGGYTCTLKSDGSLNCWGDNEFGQSTPPPGTFTQVSAGFVHTCGLKSDGSLACWGYNIDGQSSPPGGTFTQVSAGSAHTCGLKSDGSLACWGSDIGQLNNIPTGTFTQVSAGYYQTCGLKSDGTLSCWGSNEFGQLNNIPTGTFTQVSAGGWHICGLRSDGTLSCWGSNEISQLNNIPNGTFTQVSAGTVHTCGLKSDGSLACWGNNDYGQSSPPPGTFAQVSAGGFHTCALKSDGSLVCWGDNTFGQSTSPIINLPLGQVDVYEPPEIAQGGDCIDGSIIDIYHHAIGEGWTIWVNDSTNSVNIDKAAVGPGGTFHLPRDPLYPFPAGTYTLTLQAPAGWQAFTPIGFTVTLNGSPDHCAQVRFKMEALANLCVYKYDGGVTPEVGIPGFEITVTNTDTKQEWNLKTDGVGKACFYDLPPGPYDVQEKDQVGWILVSPLTNPQHITLVSPRSPGSVVPLVFRNKQDHDATICVEKKDNFGNLVNDWQIILYRPDGSYLQDRYTGSDGTGLTCFHNLALGEWEVGEVFPTPLNPAPPLLNPPWWAPASTNLYSVILATPGETQRVTFVNQKLGCVDGYTINDLDQGLAGWKITAQNGTDIREDITRASPLGYLGYFQFYLPLGTWTISEEIKGGWTPVTPATFTVTVTKPGICEHVRFKNATKNACVDVYKKDANGNVGIPGWEINIQPAYYSGTDELQKTGATDGTGHVRFDGLTPGNYTLWETLQTGWTYVSPPNGIITPVALEAGGTCKVVVFTNKQTRTPAVPATGSISGRLSYPSEMIPPLVVVAFKAANPSIYYFVDTSSWGFGDPFPNRFYTIAGLPAGVYHVVSYLLEYSGSSGGGYTQAVPCGLVLGCNDHSLIDVTVIAGQTTSNINPDDWYGGPGIFPPMPNP